mgnify:CR=1 FL=1
MSKELADFAEVTAFSHPPIVNGLNIKQSLNIIKKKTGKPASRVCMDGVVNEIEKIQLELSL